MCLGAAGHGGQHRRQPNRYGNGDPTVGDLAGPQLGVVAVRDLGSACARVGILQKSRTDRQGDRIRCGLGAGVRDCPADERTGDQCCADEYSAADDQEQAGGPSLAGA